MIKLLGSLMMGFHELSEKSKGVLGLLASLPLKLA